MVGMMRFFFFASIMVFALSGCIFVVGGAVGALGGYAISQDTIQGETSNSYSDVWGSAVKVARILGDTIMEDKAAGSIEAKVNNATVWVDMEEIVKGAVRLRVKARKFLFPDLKLAQKVYVKILENASR